jgi:hypothetical protein
MRQLDFLSYGAINNIVRIDVLNILTDHLSRFAFSPICHCVQAEGIR